jgi:hypothetical protein
MERSKTDGCIGVAANVQVERLLTEYVKCASDEMRLNAGISLFFIILGGIHPHNVRINAAVSRCPASFF